MRILLTVMQAISAVLLALANFFPPTRVIWRRILIIVGGFGYIVATGMIGIETARLEEDLKHKIEEKTDTIFNIVAEQVMESPKEVTSIPTPEPSMKMQIKSPQDGSIVPWRPYVKGTVTDLDAEVWVIVRPVDTSAYLVQPSVTVSNGGTWMTQVYLGRAGDIDVGKQFEIMAVANPKGWLSEADILGGWPDAQWSSQVITVTRE